MEIIAIIISVMALVISVMALVSNAKSVQPRGLRGIEMLARQMDDWRKRSG